MSVPEVHPAAVFVPNNIGKTPPGSPEETPPTTPGLNEVVSVVGQAALSQVHKSGPSEKKREISCEKKETDDKVADVAVPKIELSPESLEAKFVEDRKAEIIKGLDAWEIGYAPYANGWLSLLPGVSGLVHQESLSAVQCFKEGVKEAKTRRKLVSVLEKNRQILADNQGLMDDSTINKVKSAYTLIDNEVECLKKFGPIPSKVATGGPKKEKTLQRDDSLYEVKHSLWQYIEEWKKDFVPYPSVWFLFWMAPKLKEITDRLCGDLFRDIRKAQTLADLAKKLTVHQNRFRGYVASVDSATAAKMETVCAFIQEKAQALAAT